MSDIDTVIGLKLELEAKFKKLKEANESLLKQNADLKTLITVKDDVISRLSAAIEPKLELLPKRPGYIV